MAIDRDIQDRNTQNFLSVLKGFESACSQETGVQTYREVMQCTLIKAVYMYVFERDPQKSYVEISPIIAEANLFLTYQIKYFSRVNKYALSVLFNPNYELLQNIATKSSLDILLEKFKLKSVKRTCLDPRAFKQLVDVFSDLGNILSRPQALNLYMTRQDRFDYVK